MKKIFLIALASAALAGQAATPQDAEALKDKLYTQIVQSYTARDWDEVVSLTERLISAGADVDDLEMTYCDALSKSGRGAEGISRLEKYLAREKDDYQAWQVLGELRSREGDNLGAAAAYTESANANPNFARPYVSLGRLYAQLDKAKSIENFNKGIRIFLLSERPDAAIQIGLEAMNVDASNVPLLMMMGDALVSAGMPQKALAFYAEVISVSNSSNDPDLDAVAEADYNIALIYYKDKEYAKALGFLESMFASEPLLSTDKGAYGSALSMAAACATRLGKKKNSDEYLAKAETFTADAKSIYQDFLSITE